MDFLYDVKFPIEQTDREGGREREIEREKCTYNLFCLILYVLVEGNLVETPRMAAKWAPCCEHCLPSMRFLRGSNRALCMALSRSSIQTVSLTIQRTKITWNEHSFQILSAHSPIRYSRKKKKQKKKNQHTYGMYWPHPHIFKFH